MKNINKQNQRLLLNLKDLEFEDAFKIQEYQNISKENYRYSIETQTNDLLEDILSNIPKNKRTEHILNNVHLMITRFIQLRKSYSEFDEKRFYKNWLT